VGLHAFAFGAVVWAIYRVRQVLFRDHWMTQMLVTFVFGALVRVGVMAYDSMQAEQGPALSANIAPALGVALYTALLAPCLHWPLIRMYRWTGLKPTQRTALSAT
jgi:cell shape-determining protein MreD